MTLNDEYQSMAANAIAHEAQMVGLAWQNAAYDQSRPSVLWRPKLSLDGDKWCALYGDNLHDGVAGFGESPEQAMWEFDKEWSKKWIAPAQDPVDVNVMPLRCKAVGGDIDMGIGMRALCFAAEQHPDLWDGESPASVPVVKITDVQTFALEVVRAINAEGEDGSTLLTRMLDAAILKAVESGCEGVEYSPAAEVGKMKGEKL